MNNYKFFFVTPILGLIRNYIKYKNISIIIFFRTPIISIIIFELIQAKYPKAKYSKHNNILLGIILERWFMLLGKSLISLYNNDYITKRNKYIKKYNMEYKNN